MMEEIVAMPASPSQRDFWLLERLRPGDPALHVRERFRLSGPLDKERLEAALNRIVERHEILRSNFEMLDDEVKQIVRPGERWVALEESGDFECPRFHLDFGPLLRAGLLRIDEQEHELVLTLHHIVADGWSMGVLAHELGAFYSGDALPPLETQFADHTIWQLENRDREAAAHAETYWEERLNGVPHFRLDLAVSQPGEGVGIAARQLPAASVGLMMELARSQGTTPFTTLLSLFSALLYRYTGETDIVLGTQVAGRDTLGAEPLIGPFIRTSVLRMDLSGNPAFQALLGRVQRVVTDMLDHQPAPPVRAGIFEINVICQRDFLRPWQNGVLQLTRVPTQPKGALYPLTVYFVEDRKGWQVSLEYDASRFEEASVEALLNHFENLMGAVSVNPAKPISELDYLGVTEEYRMVHQWNQTAAPYPAEQPVHRLIEKQVDLTPRAVAVSYEAESLTYLELNRRANQLARYLQTRGVTPGMRIGLSVERSVDMIVSILAVLKAGAVYVPLDSALPEERRVFMAKDCGVKLIISSFTLSERREIARQDGHNLKDGSSAEDTAYILYTSGSTGTPKGVGIHHKALVNLLWAVLREPGISPADHVLAITTLSFDIAGLELFGPLIAGARLTIAGRQQAADGLALRDLLHSSAATILQATPSTWRMLVESGWRDSPKLKMLCGGEPLPRDLADSLLERGGELWNLYGPTETTIWSSWGRIEAGSTSIRAGKAAPNQKLYVLDAERRTVPQGVTGELYIGGDGVAQGYINRPELTAERFIANPFAAGSLYRTGDRARFHSDRSVEILGRLDSQVKIRGHRIEIGEVESAIASHPNVVNAAVVVRDGNLAGYFESAIGPDELRRYLEGRLPEYMVPRYLMPVARIPLTTSGKVDRKALPEIPSPAKSASIAEPPRDALESTLIGIWESVLDVRPIGARDNFFEMGGHSILAARMFARMEKVLGKTLPLATLFQGPTVARLAELLRDSGWIPPWRSLVPIRPEGLRPPFFFVHAIGGNVLSFAGFAAHFDADQPVYGLQAKGLDRREKPHVTVEEMASDYVREVRALQSEGPYFLGGFSAGGMVAYEMAAQLRASGQQVALLALLDTPAAEASGLRRFPIWIRMNLHYARKQPLSAFSQQKARNLTMWARMNFWRLARRLGMDVSPAMLDAEEAFLLSLQRYSPRPYDGDAVLFRAKEGTMFDVDPTLGWSGLIRGDLAVEEVSGDHDTFLYEPHIGVLARALNDRLVEAVQIQTNSLAGLTLATQRTGSTASSRIAVF